MNKIKVEIASTPRDHQKGLMFRKAMDYDSGMLFKFKHPQKLRFWGVNTFIPLDIAFVTPTNTIDKICHIVPMSKKIVSSDGYCDKAVEVNANYFVENNIRVGDSINIDYDEAFVTFKKNEG
ncbi:MAG: DUF192 domain-containing protein [Elusimicrobiota bacterium]